MVTIWVGPLAEKEKFTIHKDALSSRANRILGILDSLPPQEAEPAFIDRAYLLDEQLETFRTFLKWLYAAYIGVAVPFLPSSNLALFQLYIFAYKYCINFLEDAIVSVLYKKFANSDTLWLSLGSDKSALEALIQTVPPDNHLYRLVVRSVAYSMRLPTAAENNWSGSRRKWSEPEHKSAAPGHNWCTNRTEFKWPEPQHKWSDNWSEPGDQDGSPAFPSRPATEDQVEAVMNSVPGELWVAISRENLLALTLGSRSQDFVSAVGHENEFLRQCEDHGDVDLSAS
ncbi:hypothetical protein KVR01_009644 [Diaporthe batatas]|uniref:uncharacterized protein n=1 Tax=Diaporthe batatas TaxID=748121 RepID=UPI001D0440FD|nr:uncharacterized protein KVR01_009644 [Diaporthe batatas]KAG8160108.1 hypothetical protein KVR01_009644 [Diaporthe batatas]